MEDYMSRRPFSNESIFGRVSVVVSAATDLPANVADAVAARPQSPSLLRSPTRPPRPAAAGARRQWTWEDEANFTRASEVAYDPLTFERPAERLPVMSARALDLYHSRCLLGGP
jgi:hypothetical protein